MADSPPPLTTPYVLKDHVGSPAPHCCSTTGRRRLGAVISCERQRDLHLRLCLSRVRETIVGAHSAQQRKLGPLSEADKSIEATMCPICFSTAHCWAWVSSTEKENKPSLKGIEPAQAHPQGFCCSNLGSDLSSRRLSRVIEQRGGPAAHLALPCQLQPHPLPRPWLPAHPEQRHDLCSHQIQLSYQRHWAHLQRDSPT